MSENYIIAIDQGTTSTRVIAFSLTGQVLGISQQDITQYYPQNGWVEHDAEEIWVKTLECLSNILDEQTAAGRVAQSIGITNQRETCLLWDRKTGEPLTPAIVWQDRRTASLCDELRRQGHEEMINQKTGLLLDSYFSATKMKWLLDSDNHRERALSGDVLTGTIESYLVYRLTAGSQHITDLTNASRTMLCNIMTGQWDTELLDLFDIPVNILATITDNTGDFGEIDESLPGAGISINGLIGDQQSASIGQGCIKTGMIKSTYGTGCFVLQNTGPQRQYSRNKLLATVAYCVNGEISYAIEGSIFNAGTVTQFLRDQMELINDVDEVDALCRSVIDTGGVYMVPAFTGLGAPHWDPNARGMITGLTRDTTKAHIVRAGMESVAYQTDDLLTAFFTDSGTKPSVIRVDGGMCANDWLMQFLADTLDVTIERPMITETTAYGAAILAGIGKGLWTSLEQACQTWRLECKFSANVPSLCSQETKLEWQRAIELAKMK